MSSHAPLLERIARVRSRLRVAVALYGGGWLIAAAGGAALLAGWLDWALHFDSAWVRATILVGILLTAAGIVWKLLILPWRTPLGDDALALAVEARFPGFREELASAVSFSAADRDPRVGSPVLQQELIAATRARTERLDFAAAVRLSAAALPCVATALVLLVGAGLVGSAPTESRVAAQRLLWPFAITPWPPRTSLELLSIDWKPVDLQSPFRIIRGGKLELFVVDRAGRLPESVEMLYQVGDEPEVGERLRELYRRDSTGASRQVALVSLPAERGPIRFRIRGGDDDTLPALELHVVEPPAIDSLQLELTPPAYTARPPQRRPAGDGRIEAIVGTRVAVAATATRPLASAEVLLRGKATGRTTIAADGTQLRGEFVVSEPGQYGWQWRLRDREGVPSSEARAYELRAVADLPPEVALDEPAGDVTATAHARLALRIRAKDDLGLRGLALQHRPLAENATTTSIALADQLPRPLQQKQAYDWDLAPLKLPPGARLAFLVEAADYCDVGPPRAGQSASRTLTILSDDQKQAEIIARQGELLHKLEAAEQLLSQSDRDAEQLVEKFSARKPPASADLDLLKQMQSRQRKGAELLVGDPQAAARLVEEMLGEFERNGLADRETVERLSRFRQQFAELGGGKLARVREQTSRALKAAEMAEAGRAEAENSLRTARADQKSVLEALRKMSGELGRWQEWDRLAAGVQGLVQAQEEIQSQTAEIAGRTLSQAKGEPSDGERDRLMKLSEKQNELSQQAERLASQLAADDQARDPNRAALKQGFQRIEPAAKMRDVARNLSQGNVGQALSDEQKLVDELRKLGPSGPAAEKALAEELAPKVADHLKSLAARQQGVVEETRRLEAERAARGSWSRGQLKSLGAVADTQSALEGETKKLTEQLKSAPVYEWTLRKQTERMAAAAGRLKQRATDAETVRLETAAWEGLKQLVAALEPPKRTEAAKPPKPPQGMRDAEAPRPADGIPPLAQLVMLKSLQQELQRRTAALEGRQAPATPRESNEIAAEQAKLAELLQSMVESVKPAAPPKEKS